MILYILFNIILPIFILLGVGMLADRVFKPDLPTLSKLNFYVFVPALAFVRLLDSELSGDLIGLVVGFNIIHTAILIGLCWLVFRWKPLRQEREMLTAATLFNNCGNYGIPFAQLAFGDFGVQVMAFVLVFQNVIMFTIGLWLLGSERGHWKERLLTPLKAPVLYAVVVALLLNTLHIRLPEAIHFPLVQLSNGLVPIALLTLGVQLSRARWAGQFGVISAGLVMRLIVAPLLAAGLAWVWQTVAPVQSTQIFPVLICGAALPVAVNVYIFAMEYNRQPELASRIIFWSTLASSVTLTLWLAIFTQ
jgi:predicted permease